MFLNDELSKEGADLWNKIGTDEEFIEVYDRLAGKTPVKVKQPKINRDEIIKLRDNSLRCEQTAKEEMEKFIKAEKYFKATEMRVAEIIHRNFAKRLNNILNGIPAFNE